jgi:ADP-ribosylglycohydrolase
MALVVADYCVSLGLNGNQAIDFQWSEGLASAFICDMKNPYGWKVSFRAPGISTMNALELLSSHDKNEWPLLYKKFENHQGCGSVMRVHPCGLLFWNNLETVKRAAIAQSKVTHNSSIANASCAALSVGVAFLLQATSDRMNSDDHEICKSLIALMSYIANEIDSQFLVSLKINEAYQAGVKMQALLAQYGITTPEQLIEALKNETSDIARYHFEICKKFPGWKADDAVAAAVYSVVATISSPYLAIMLGVHSTGDSDSIASLAGALIGAWHGKQALPEIVWEREVPRIEGIETIKAYAKKVYDLSLLMVS